MTVGLACVVAALIAALLTFLELDETFYMPPAGPSRRKLNAWRGGFVAANAALAVATVFILQSVKQFGELHWFLEGCVAALAYMALVRFKFASLPVGGSTVDFGLEAVYESSKRYAYKRINAHAKKARAHEVDALVAAHPLKELIMKARDEIQYDELLDSATKEAQQAWILDVVESDLDELEKKRYMANYICSGRQVSRVSLDQG